MIVSNNTMGWERRSPAVSIVIPAYNASSFIPDTLDSVLAQTFTDYEVIVVNDGSPDTAELEQVLESHPLPILYLSQQNKGVSAARNAGINVARGTFYAQLDSDDQWEPNYLEEQLGFLTRDPNIALVYPNATIFGDVPERGIEFMKLCPSEGEVSFASLVRARCTVMTCVTARISAIREAGLFDESLRGCEDFDLWLRIVKNGGRITYHRKVLARYRKRVGSLSSDRIWMTANLLKVLEKATRIFDLTAAERKEVDDEIKFRAATLQLFEGKQLLALGDGRMALKRFEGANQFMRSKKLALVIWLLRFWPRLLIRAFAARERFLPRREKQLWAGVDSPRGVSL